MKLIRKEKAEWTEGKLIYPDDSFTFCLERPWLNNKPYVSCIPYGQYIVVPDNTGKHRYYRVTNVPNRSHIEFHGATDVNDLQGCLAPCLGIINGKSINCRDALNKLTEWYSDDQGNKKSFVLDIIKYNPFKHGKWGE